MRCPKCGYVAPPKGLRSGQQNKYYWSVIVAMMAEHCGYEPEEMHEVLAMRFLRIEDDPILGTPRRQRTPKTNTAEFTEYIEQCRRLGAQLGLYIPDPWEWVGE
jgi:hypothetical protein